MDRTRARTCAPAAIVLGAAVAAWLLTGVGLGDVLLFLAHELAFVLVPGCLTYLALSSRRPGALKLGAIGYALGSVLEILAFALTAALHARGALWAYPPVVIVAALLVARRREVRGAERDAPAGGPMSSALAALCLAALGYIVVAYFLFNPLPGRAGSVVYVSDLVFHLGVAAEALHHWPISDPKVAGVALPVRGLHLLQAGRGQPGDRDLAANRPVPALHRAADPRHRGAARVRGPGDRRPARGRAARRRPVRVRRFAGARLARRADLRQHRVLLALRQSELRVRAGRVPRRADRAARAVARPSPRPVRLGPGDAAADRLLGRQGDDPPGPARRAGAVPGRGPRRRPVATRTVPASAACCSGSTAPRRSRWR